MFVGCGASLTDPNSGALSWILKVIIGSEYRHFCLCRDDDLELVQKEHPPQQRIFAVGYGATYADMAAFLRRLTRAPLWRTASASGQSATRGMETPTADDPGDVLRTDSVLGGKYKVGRLLGRGGFGATYLAWDLNLPRRVAIKEFLPRQLASRMPGGTQVRAYTGNQNAFNVGLEKFLEEARHLAQFGDHPGIIRVLDFFEENGTGYMVMEYLDGSTLDQYVIATGPLDIPVILELLIPVADALRACHAAGLIHRDISPDNIFLTGDGRVKLLDFGAARAAIGSQSTNLSVILKEGYAPFEQYQRNGRQGPWTDIYALTATLYRLLTGDLPVTAPDRVAGTPLPRVSERGIKLPTGLQALLDKGLAIRPEERYQTVDAFLSDLKGIIDQLPRQHGTGQMPRVFISYSHRDTRWRERLEVHLKPIVDSGLIISWNDRLIDPGNKWREEIQLAIEAAKIAILLVSADFLASDFIRRNELPPLLKAAESRGCRILPIIVRPCRFLKTPELSQFQAFNSPERPLSAMNPNERESLFSRVADTIENILGRDALRT
jgi:serine/threonine protein kinase